MFEQEEKALQELKESLNKLTQIKAEDLGRSRELGIKINFEEGIPLFERTLKLFRDLAECNFDNVPVGILDSLKQSADQALGMFDQIRNFSHEVPNPRQARDQIVKNIEEHYPKHFSKVYPIIAYSTRKGTDFAKLEREGREKVELLTKTVNDVETLKKQTEDETEAILRRVRKAAAEAGVSQHAVHFMDQSNHHKKSSKIWFWGTVGIGTATILFAFFSFQNVASSELPYLIRFAISRILIISILSYGLVWSGRNYSAQKHNEVINKHRQNALSTFETFVKATDDPETKNAVLLQATHSIFTPQRSGYLSKDSEPSSTNRFIEILRQIAPSAKET